MSLDALAESGESFIGSNYGSTVPGREFPHIAELHLMDWFPVDELISHRIPLEGVNGAFDAQGKAIPFFLGEAVTEEANLLTRRPFSLATLLTGHSSHGRLLSLATGPMRPSTPASPRWSRTSRQLRASGDRIGSDATARNLRPDSLF